MVRRMASSTLPRHRKIRPADLHVQPDAPRRKGIAYARQSEDDSDGIERQLEDCRDLARRHNVEIVRVITDNDVSASKNKARPGYDGELIPAIESGEAEVILAQTQDRLLRKPIEMEHLIDLVQRTGDAVDILLYRATMDLSNANGRAMARQAAVWARLEVEQKAERRVRAEQARAQRGQPPLRRAFGYEPRGWDKRPAEAALVRQAYDMALAGKTITAIVRMLNEAGLPTASGSPTWNRRGVLHVLRNARYAGIRTYYGEEVCPGQWPAIVSREEYERVVALLDDPTRKTTTGNERKHLGSGLYLCGLCLEAGEDPDTIRLTSPSNRRKASRAYTCKRYHHISRHQDGVDTFVEEAVRKLLAEPTIASVLTRGMANVAPLIAEADAIKAKIARAQRDYDDEKIEADDLRRVKTRRAAELTVIERKIAGATRRSRLAQLANSPDPVAAYDAADLDMKREVIDALMQVVLMRGKPGKRFDPTSVRLTPQE